MRVRVAVGWRRGGALSGQWIARADGARERGLARGSRAVCSIRFESAQTHEAVQLPASVADLDAALAKMNADNLTHFFGLDSALNCYGRGSPARAANSSKKKLENSGRPLTRPVEVCANGLCPPSSSFLAQTLNLGLYAPLGRST